jgi:hypothetical protein
MTFNLYECVFYPKLLSVIYFFFNVCAKKKKKKMKTYSRLLFYIYCNIQSEVRGGTAKIGEGCQDFQTGSQLLRRRITK